MTGIVRAADAEYRMQQQEQIMDLIAKMPPILCSGHCWRASVSVRAMAPDGPTG